MSWMFFSGFLFISTHISLNLLSLGSAKAYIKWGNKTKRSFDGKLCQKYLYQKLSNTGNWFSSYCQKCRGCFWDTV